MWPLKPEVAAGKDSPATEVGRTLIQKMHCDGYVDPRIADAFPGMSEAPVAFGAKLFAMTQDRTPEEVIALLTQRGYEPLRPDAAMQWSALPGNYHQHMENAIVVLGQKGTTEEGEMYLVLLGFGGNKKEGVPPKRCAELVPVEDVIPKGHCVIAAPKRSGS